MPRPEHGLPDRRADGMPHRTGILAKRNTTQGATGMVIESPDRTVVCQAYRNSRTNGALDQEAFDQALTAFSNSYPKASRSDALRVVRWIIEHEPALTPGAR
jgi:hypothetical protein